MGIWFGISVVLLLLCMILAGYLFTLKGQMKNTGRELRYTREKAYNRQVTVSLFDKDLTELATEFNRNLDYQKELKLQSERAEQTLKQSISDIAHDLRTPLTVIAGNLQMLSQESTLSEQGRTYLHICQENSRELKTMVDDFFEMSVLESDSRPAELERVDITKLLMQFIVDHEAVIRSHKLEPDIYLPEKSIVVYANEDMLRRMLGNLLNNVLKYAEDAFRISMEEIEGGTKCRITFANRLIPDSLWHGVLAAEGEEALERLFDRTYRGSRARYGSGAGLGLYIVRLLAQKQQAEAYAQIQGDSLEVHLLFSLDK